MWHHPSTKQGSAPLLTLMVVSLMLVVVLSFVVFVRMELRNIINRQELALARANARLGANLAISRLQETTGSDTRVTSPIVTATMPNNLLIGQAIDASAYRSDGSGGLEINPNYSRNVRYLISGNTFNPATYNPFNADGTPAAGHAMLVGGNSVSLTEDENADSIPDGFVAAPVEALPASAGRGAFAWWVSDEGAKAQINITDEFFDATLARNSRAQGLTIQRSGSETVLSNFDPDNIDHNAILRRATNLEQLNLVTGFELGPGVATDSFHDVTMGSLGIPTDTKRGGLKRDITAVIKEAEANGGVVDTSGTQYTQLLAYNQARMAQMRAETQALESHLGKTHDQIVRSDWTTDPVLSVAPERHFNALRAMTLRADQVNAAFANMLFPPLTDLDIIWDQGGVSWDRIISWLTLRERKGSGGSDAVTAEVSYGDTIELSPVIARVGVSNTLTLNYPEVTYHVIPVVTLWNPYDVPLVMNPSNPWNVRLLYNITNREAMLFRLRVNHPDWQAPNESRYDHIPPVDGRPRSSLWTPVFYIPFFNQAAGNNAGGFTERFVFQIRGATGGTRVVIPPGQARIFTMHEHQEFQLNAAGDYDSWAVLREGLPPAVGQFGYYGRVNVETEMTDPNSLTHTEFGGGTYWGPVTGQPNGYHRDAGVDRRRGGRGWGIWQPNRGGGGNFGRRPEPLPYPFPLDPRNLDTLRPSERGYTDATDPAYQAELAPSCTGNIPTSWPAMST